MTIRKKVFSLYDKIEQTVNNKIAIRQNQNEQESKDQSTILQNDNVTK